MREGKEFDDDTVDRAVQAAKAADFDCTGCKHWFGHETGDIAEDTCKAFPDEIPMDILTGEFIHNKPYEGDNGIQFEPVGKGKNMK